MEESELEQLSAFIRDRLKAALPEGVRNDPALRKIAREELGRVFGGVSGIGAAAAPIPLIKVVAANAQPDGSIHVLLKGPRELMERHLEGPRGAKEPAP